MIYDDDVYKVTKTKYCYNSTLWSYKCTCSITLIANIFHKQGLGFFASLETSLMTMGNNKNVLTDWIRSTIKLLNYNDEKHLYSQIFKYKVKIRLQMMKFKVAIKRSEDHLHWNCSLLLSYYLGYCYTYAALEEVELWYKNVVQVKIVHSTISTPLIFALTTFSSTKLLAVWKNWYTY